MAHKKSPRKRKPAKSGHPPATSRISRTIYPKRFLVTHPPVSDYDDPADFFYDTPQEAIQHCVRLGPQFFLDTQPVIPEVHIIRGFEEYPGQADETVYDCTDGAMTESMSVDVFMVLVGYRLISVSYAPWDKHTDNWADRHEEDGEYYNCGQYDDFRFTGKIPGL